MKVAVRVALVVLIVIACSGMHTLEGSMEVIESLPLEDANSIGAPCTGLGGFDDLRRGTTVMVKDENGKVLAVGKLEGGLVVALETCRFTFKVANIPDADFYQIEVSHRGALTYSRGDLDKRDWKVELSLS